MVVFASGCTQQNNTTQNNTTQQNATNTTKVIDVVALQKGPETAKKGMNITIQYEVRNKGTEAVNNVQIRSQEFQQNVGILNPGENRSFNVKIYIPTDAEVQQDFGQNAAVPNPFPIGAFSVTFNDASGKNYTVMSNSMEIRLV